MSRQDSLEFLIFVLPCPVCWFISDRSCQAFQSHLARREKKIKRSSRGWRGEKGLDSYSQFSLMIRSSLACCCAGAHLGGDPAHLGWFMTRPCKCSPLHSSGPRQLLPAICFHPNTGGDSLLERGLGGPQRSTRTISLENLDDLLSFRLFVAILLPRTSRFLV